MKEARDFGRDHLTVPVTDAWTHLLTVPGGERNSCLVCGADVGRAVSSVPTLLFAKGK